ncbi:MAG: hypothetical protein EB000_02215 [Alphaproteobacteria bacterium]|nr:hypothetical protein [Alphaproteobacteria bacterium]
MFLVDVLYSSEAGCRPLGNSGAAASEHPWSPCDGARWRRLRRQISFWPRAEPPAGDPSPGPAGLEGLGLADDGPAELLFWHLRLAELLFWHLRLAELLFWHLRLAELIILASEACRAYYFSISGSHSLLF